MKKHIQFVIVFFLLFNSVANTQNKLIRSWIKVKVENLSDKEVEPDTSYTRYGFDKTHLIVSFYPGWNDSFKQKWLLKDNLLTLAFDTYEIEELTDTCLSFSLQGFRRFRFLSEDFLSSQKKFLDSIGEYNGKPLYRSNEYITPRYSGKEDFRNMIQKNADGYNIRKACYFFATFIVTENGKVENIKVISSISEGFDKGIIKQLLSTSGKWKPAQFAGTPIQTETYYDIKYLDSPFQEGGRL